MFQVDRTEDGKEGGELSKLELFRTKKRGNLLTLPETRDTREPNDEEMGEKLGGVVVG